MSSCLLRRHGGVWIRSGRRLRYHKRSNNTLGVYTAAAVTAGVSRAASSEAPTTGPIPTTTTTATGTTCSIGERYKYHTIWPSEEHAAFAFAQLAGSGSDDGTAAAEIGLRDFMTVLRTRHMDYQLGDPELARVFATLDTNNDGRISLEEFTSGRASHPFVKAIVEALVGSGGNDGSRSQQEQAAAALSSSWCDPAAAPFDCTRSTADYYQAPYAPEDVVGDYAAIRRSLDYKYHNNYTPARQLFQDTLIQHTVLLEGSGCDHPWLVFTCGMMGAGKGWVLGWMSSNNILPLERVSKIDPDAFKVRMPEWSLYQQQHQNGMQSRSAENTAGTMTHAESSYIAEVAQRVAMNNSMNVWVDGSLQDWAWYTEELQRIRQRYPHYQIAIIAIDAPHDIIATNIQRRAQETGRHVPKEVQQQSIEGLHTGIRKLIHLVDLVAHVHNRGTSSSCSSSSSSSSSITTGKTDEPLLRSICVVDRSGNWDLIRNLTSKHARPAT